MAPENLRYTADHEWVRQESDGSVVVGITDHAATALGDVVYVSLPVVGVSLEIGDAFGEVESTKSVSEVYAPLAGEVVDRNESLESQPDLINSDPFGDGWIVKLTPAEGADLDGLLSAADYAQLIQ